MYEAKLVDPQLAARMISLARKASAAGMSIGSTTERIVGALLNDRADWLPPDYPLPLEAIMRLHSGGSDWWHTMLYVYDRGWKSVEMHEERL